MVKFRYFVVLLASHSLFGLTTLNVTLSSDNNPGGFGEVGDLRYCLNTMNTNLNSMIDDYAITFDFPMTIILNGILPVINNSANAVSITIGNPGFIATVIIDGNNGSYPGFFIPIGTVTIQNMIFQNLCAQGGAGGDGIAGGGGGLGAGGAIYAPQNFLNGSYPSITLSNVSITNCSAIGGDGGSFIGDTATGSEGGGGGGGFSGNGGSIIALGSTGGAGGGGFGGDGGDVTTSVTDSFGGGGSGGGGFGSRATLGTLANLGNGGSDQDAGSDGNGYGLTITAGSGGGGLVGGDNAGGAGGGASGTLSGGGGGGSNGADGLQAEGSTPPGGSSVPSGGNGGDGGGGGGGGIVVTNFGNGVSGQAGTGGYAGGGGGGAGTGASDASYTVQGGSGGVGGGGGGGGVNQLGTTPATGGNSLGGGGGGGGGPIHGLNQLGGTDIGYLGGGAGGMGDSDLGSGIGGGGGGGGSGLGGAIFVDSNLNFTIQALSGIPTVFNTIDNTTQAGTGGTGSNGGADGTDGSALGDSIFLRSGATLTFMATDTNDLLTLGDGVDFADDTDFGGTGTAIFVRGNGTVVYNGSTDYQGRITVYNATFEVNGLIDAASIFVCRNRTFSLQRGTLTGNGTLNGTVYANSGAIWPDTAETLTLGSLTLSPADHDLETLGSLVHIDIDETSTPSVVAVTGAAALAGVLEFTIDSQAQSGTYIVLTSSGITGTFDSVRFTGPTPNYTLSYLPEGSPTFIQLDYLGFIQPASNFQGEQLKNNFGFEYELYNQLTWTLSVSDNVAGYYIYRDDVEIAQVDSATHSYQDHNRAAGVSYSYSLAAVDGDGNLSSRVDFTVPSL